MIVIDASALLEVLLRTPAAGGVEEWLFDPGQTLHAPHLLDVEVAQVIRRYAANGEIDSDRGRAAVADLADFPLHRYPHDVLLPRVWELRNNLTAPSTSHWRKRSTRRCSRATVVLQQRLVMMPGSG
jgi:predicted nucleic acid-binding protein